MNIIKVVALMTTASFLSAPVGAETHANYMKQVATYKAMSGFNHVVGSERFVGYFLAGPERCDVTVLQARADDEALIIAPRRIVMQIAAGSRSELDAGFGAALAIACTVDADAIRIAPQSKREVARAAVR